MRETNSLNSIRLRIQSSMTTTGVQFLIQYFFLHHCKNYQAVKSVVKRHICKLDVKPLTPK